MPKEIEDRLKKEAEKKADEKGLTGERRERFIGSYVYGTLQHKFGWKRGR